MSTWFGMVTSVALSVAAISSALFFLDRFTSPTGNDAWAVSGVVTAVVVVVVVVHGVLWSRWRQNFPPVQVYRDGEKPTAERVNHLLTKEIMWTVGVVLVPVLLGILFGA
ncbi:hypothetical protein [Arthrobacter sp. SX1312]|uniref:hypothetical protein n=1 Tax=Arthrobacter sp. SX1312 TaxID=2058896 RepID=UPI0015E1F634|nr:hypothetical protein [Arthrobacter sp. SX1312]